jgi:hypothetical protein
MDAALLTGMFGLNYDVLRKNLDGITHSESLRSPSLGGNNLNTAVRPELGLLIERLISGKLRRASTGPKSSSWPR